MESCLEKHCEKFNLENIDFLRNKKSLLGFSYGLDSTCLFYLLLDLNINFDIAIINYNIRKNAALEVESAKKLAKKYNKKIYILNAKKLDSNFEARAREVRYTFFKKIIDEKNYSYLILAHQLNDRFEWFLMQFFKGAGLNNLLGFENEINGINIIRPLINTPRTQIKAFLKTRKIKYFSDKSNKNTAFLRNLIRKKYAKKMMKDYSRGIAASLSYLANERDLLFCNEIKKNENIFRIEIKCDLQNLDSISKCAKKLGYVISKSQRDEIIKSRYCCILGDKIIIDCNKDFIFVAKNKPKIAHPKSIRDSFRKAQIPPKIRAVCDISILQDWDFV